MELRILTCDSEFDKDMSGMEEGMTMGVYSEASGQFFPTHLDVIYDLF